MAGVVNGTDYMILIGGKYVANMISHSITFESSTRDISVRETDNWTTYIHGMREWTIEVEGKWAQTYDDGTLDSRHTAGAFQIPAMPQSEVLALGYFGMQEKLWVSFVGFVTGNIVWTGWMWLQSANIDTPLEDNSNIAMSFKGNNQPALSTIS